MQLLDSWNCFENLTVNSILLKLRMDYIPALATETAYSAAWKQIFGTDVCANWAFAFYANSVAYRFNCAKSPAIQQQFKFSVGKIWPCWNKRFYHEPQLPWSLISFIVGQSGHCSLASKLSGNGVDILCKRTGKRLGFPMYLDGTPINRLTEFRLV